jgi:uncharacterized phiE125 gp8 family phage protein
MLFQLTPSAPVEGYGEALLPLDAAKLFLRVDGTDEDSLVEALRDAAIDMVEQYTNLRLAPCSGIEARFGAFEPILRLGVGPAFSLDIVSVHYTIDGTDTLLPSTDWMLAPGGALMPAPGKAWPTANGGIVVTFTAGYPAGRCPGVLIHAAKMFATHLYDNRDVVLEQRLMGELPLGFRTLCDLKREPVL